MPATRSLFSQLARCLYRGAQRTSARGFGRCRAWLRTGCLAGLCGGFRASAVVVAIVVIVVVAAVVVVSVVAGVLAAAAAYFYRAGGFFAGVGEGAHGGFSFLPCGDGAVLGRFGDLLVVAVPQDFFRGGLGLQGGREGLGASLSANPSFLFVNKNVTHFLQKIDRQDTNGLSSTFFGHFPSIFFDFSMQCRIL